MKSLRTFLIALPIVLVLTWETTPDDVRNLSHK
jgi:hypothetical protein